MQATRHFDPAAIGKRALVHREALRDLPIAVIGMASLLNAMQNARHHADCPEWANEYHLSALALALRATGERLDQIAEIMVGANDSDLEAAESAQAAMSGGGA